MKKTMVIFLMAAQLAAASVCFAAERSWDVVAADDKVAILIDVANTSYVDSVVDTWVEVHPVEKEGPKVIGDAPRPTRVFTHYRLTKNSIEKLESEVVSADPDVKGGASHIDILTAPVIVRHVEILIQQGRL